MRASMLPSEWAGVLSGVGHRLWYEVELALPRATVTTDRVAAVSDIAEESAIDQDFSARREFREMWVELFTDSTLSAEPGGLFYQAAAKLWEPAAATATSFKITAENVSFTPGDVLEFADDGERVTVASFTPGTYYHVVGVTAGLAGGHDFGCVVRTPTIVGSTVKVLLNTDGATKELPLMVGHISRPVELGEGVVRLYLLPAINLALSGAVTAPDTSEAKKLTTLDENGDLMSSVQVSGNGTFSREDVVVSPRCPMGTWTIRVGESREVVLTGPGLLVPARGRIASFSIAASYDCAGARNADSYGNYLYVTRDLGSSGYMRIYQRGSDGALTQVNEVNVGGDFCGLCVCGPSLAAVRHYVDELDSGQIQFYALANPANPSLICTADDYGMGTEYDGPVRYGGGAVVYEKTTTSDWLQLWQDNCSGSNFRNGALAYRRFRPFDLGGQPYVLCAETTRLRIIRVGAEATISDSDITDLYDVATSGHYAYAVNSSGNKVVVINLSTPLSPQKVGVLTEGLSAPRLAAVVGSVLVVVAPADGRVTMYSIADPENPVYMGYQTISELVSANEIHAVGDFVYVSNMTTGKLLLLTWLGGADIKTEGLTVPSDAFSGGFAVGDSVTFKTARTWAHENPVSVLRDVYGDAGISLEHLDVSSWWGDLAIGTLGADIGPGATQISVEVSRPWVLKAGEGLKIGADVFTIVTADVTLWPPGGTVAVQSCGPAMRGAGVVWLQRVNLDTDYTWDAAYRYCHVCGVRISLTLEDATEVRELVSRVLRGFAGYIGHDIFGVERLYVHGPVSVGDEVGPGLLVGRVETETTDPLASVEVTYAGWSKKALGVVGEALLGQHVSVDLGDIYDGNVARAFVSRLLWLWGYGLEYVHWRSTWRELLRGVGDCVSLNSAYPVKVCPVTVTGAAIEEGQVVCSGYNAARLLGFDGVGEFKVGKSKVW